VLADIYVSELEKRLADLREAETALAEAQGGPAKSPGTNSRKFFIAAQFPAPLQR